MNFDLTPEQKILRDTVRDFAEKKIKPIAAELDKSGQFPLENIKEMNEMGLLGINISKEYGGPELGSVACAIAIIELGKACASHAITISGSNMAAEVIQEFGTESVKKKHLPKICRGEYLAVSFALTEPHTGSDVANIKTTAIRKGDEYVLNGNKSFVTSGTHANVTVVWAITDKEAPKGKGISTFVVEKGTPGFIIGKEEDKLGHRASCTNQINFDNCRIPKEFLLGKEGEGFKIAMVELNGGRINIGALSLGVGFGAIEYAKEYVKERKAFGRPLSNFQAIQWMIADSYTELEAAQLLILRAAFLKDEKRNFTKEASMAKLFATETAKKVTLRAVQMLGGYGYIKEYPVERYLRDAVGTTIYEGTSEVQRMVVSKEILRK